MQKRNCWVLDVKDLTLGIRHRMMAVRCWLMAICLMAITGCTSDFTYSKYPCYLVIDNSTHMDATLMSAMNSMSPGVFCTIRCNETKKQYEFTNNLGQSSSVHYDQKDEYRTRAAGMNNALIVGFGTLTSTFYAFDRECPLCYDPDAIPVRSKPLSVSGTGVATCAVCHRQWDMNNGGNYIGTENNTDGTQDSAVKNLTRYHAGTTGPYGVLSVGN